MIVRRPKTFAAAAALGVVALLGACRLPPPAPPPPPPPPPPASLACTLQVGGPSVANVVDGHGVSVVAVTREGATLDVVTHESANAADSAAFVRQLAATHDVVASQVDAPIQALTAPPSDDTNRSQQWALDRVAFEDAWLEPGVNNGAGIVVAVVDTGVSGTHPDLAGRFVPGADFVVDGRPACTDAYGHGTHVAGIIGAIANNHLGVTGAAPGVKIMPVRVLDANGAGVVSDLVDGINWAVEHGADVINLSLGGSEPMPTVQAALADARSKGVIIVAAGGNCGSGCLPNPVNSPSYPAAYDEALAVGAVQCALVSGVCPVGAALTRAEFSSANSTIDLAAPGQAIVSTYPGGGYTTLSGTSMATPYVSAAAALELAACPSLRRANAADPAAAASTVVAKLESTATDLGAAGRDDEFGFGFVNPLALVQSGCV